MTQNIEIKKISIENNASPVKARRGRPVGSKNKARSVVFKEMLEKMKMDDSYSKQISAISELMDDVCMNAEDGEEVVRFSDRIQRVKPQYRKAAQSLLEKIAGRCSQEEFSVIAVSPAGLRIIANIESKEEMSVYVDLLLLKNADFEELVSKEKKAIDSFSNLPVLTAFGAWSQCKIEEAEAGMGVTQKDLMLAEKMSRELSEYMAFVSGANMVRKLWGKATIGKKQRGRAKILNFAAV